MSFSEVFPTLPLAALVQQSRDTTGETVEGILRRGQARNLREFAALLSPAAGERLETLAAASQRVTQRHFGKTIRLFAPLYLSNECINICKYCGFSRNNPIPRVTLSVDEVVEEARRVARQGFRSLLLVAGEHPKYVSGGYVEEVIRACLPFMPGIALELGPLETAPYR
ncbi:MAG: radical SAM protein, partial [Opitutales bacterium]